MKKSETNACLIAGVLATSLLLTGCGGGSGGGMGGLGASGTAGTAGTAGAAGGAGATGLAGTVDNLTDLLGTNGVDVAAVIPGLEGVNLVALSSADLARLDAAGITGGEDLQVLEAANGDILALTNGVNALALPGVTLPAGLAGLNLPTLPTNIANIIRGL
jgi:hypothetical protein